MNRRDVVKALFGGTGEVATWPKQRKPWHPRVKHQNEVLYKGPLMIPAHIAETCATEPDIRSRTGSLNPRKLIMCYDERNVSVSGYAMGTLKWRFRSPIPASRKMIAEIQRGTDGLIRIVAFAVADGDVYRDPYEVIRRKLRTPEQAEAERREFDASRESPRRAGGPIMPPLMPSEPPEWEYGSVAAPRGE